MRQIIQVIQFLMDWPFFFLHYEEIYGLRSYFVVDDLIVFLNCNDILDFLALESADDFHYQKDRQNCISYCIFGDGCCEDISKLTYLTLFRSNPFSLCTCKLQGI